MDVNMVNEDSLDDSESNPGKKPKPQPKGKILKPQKLPTNNKKEAKVPPTASGQTPQGQTQTPNNLNPNSDPQPPPQTRPSLLTPLPALAPTTSTGSNGTRTDTGPHVAQTSAPAPFFPNNDMSRPPPPPPTTQFRGQIIAAQGDPKGDTNINQLVQQEAALKQRLYEHYED